MLRTCVRACVLVGVCARVAAQTGLRCAVAYGGGENIRDQVCVYVFVLSLSIYLLIYLYLSLCQIAIFSFALLLLAYLRSTSSYSCTEPHRPLLFTSYPFVAHHVCMYKHTYIHKCICIPHHLFSLLSYRHLLYIFVRIFARFSLLLVCAFDPLLYCVHVRQCSLSLSLSPAPSLVRASMRLSPPL
jgi:hypothetical protein